MRDSSCNENAAKGVTFPRFESTRPELVRGAICCLRKRVHRQTKFREVRSVAAIAPPCRLDEEKAADQKLAALAEKSINRKAA